MVRCWRACTANSILTLRQKTAGVPSMNVVEMLKASLLRVSEPQVGYLLHTVHPAEGKATDSVHFTMKAALARGAAFVRDGYGIETWSPAFLEKRSRR
jgi:hypothetical protein